MGVAYIPLSLYQPLLTEECGVMEEVKRTEEKSERFIESIPLGRTFSPTIGSHM